MKNNKMIIGYTTGVFDLFHIGHLNILKRAKERCDYLIVGVSTDKVVSDNKGKPPVITFRDRKTIVESIKYVDEVVPQTDYTVFGKVEAVKRLKADILFVGSDWQNTDKWKAIENELKKIGCSVVYLPRTEGVSSSELRSKIGK